METLVYICRVPTDSNPADAPSRPNKCEGLEEYGWKKVNCEKDWLKGRSEKGTGK